MDHTPEFIDKTKSWFEITLNEHGYSFQQSVLKEVGKLFRNRNSGWHFQVAEFPVEVRGKGTRVDFILQRSIKTTSSYRLNDESTTLMLAECKRANPAYANWCFAKSKFVHNAQYDNSETLIFEAIDLSREPIEKGGLNSEGTKTVATCSRRMTLWPAQTIYNIAVEVKHDARGNCSSGDSGKDAVEGAASQLTLGLNGMVHFLVNHLHLWEQKPPAILLPVIFTTANLWGSDADLSMADLSTGNVTFQQHGFQSLPWLWYQYHLSPAIKHSVDSRPVKTNTLSDVLQGEYIRTIPIVSASGIGEFLAHVSALNFVEMT